MWPQMTPSQPARRAAAAAASSKSVMYARALGTERLSQPVSDYSAKPSIRRRCSTIRSSESAPE
jgi:hypothetical protein